MFTLGVILTYQGVLHCGYRESHRSFLLLSLLFAVLRLEILFMVGGFQVVCAHIGIR